jgi:hypothetical protein
MIESLFNIKNNNQQQQQQQQQQQNSCNYNCLYFCLSDFNE